MADAHSKGETVSKSAPTKKTKPKAKFKREILKEGYVILSPMHKYTIVSILGSGGFGDVYKVTVDNNPSVIQALKTETIDSRKQTNRLQLEAALHRRIESSKKKQHFVTFHDMGSMEKFKFIVMDVVGPSLDSVRRNVIQANFSIPLFFLYPFLLYSKATAWKLARETLQAVWDLHAIGYLHRDLKPANFAVGLPPDGVSKIYLLDFGIVRQFRSPASKRGLFTGTVRYCSRACHKGADQGAKDDLESWVYMVMDFLDKNCMPWRGDSERHVVGEKKEKLFNGVWNEKLWSVGSVKLTTIMKYVNKLQYADEPNYTVIVELLAQMAVALKVDVNAPFDWVDKIKPDMPLVPKGEMSYSQTGSEEDDGTAASNKKGPRKKKTNLASAILTKK